MSDFFFHRRCIQRALANIFICGIQNKLYVPSAAFWFVQLISPRVGLCLERQDLLERDVEQAVEESAVRAIGFSLHAAGAVGAPKYKRARLCRYIPGT